MNCLIVTPHRLGIPEMAKRIGNEWKALGHNVEYILAEGEAARVGPVTIGAPGIAVWWYKKLNQISKYHKKYDLIWTHQPIIPRLPTADSTFWNKVLVTMHTTFSREYELVCEGIYPQRLLPYYWFMKMLESRSHHMFADLEYDGPHYTVVSPHLRQEIDQSKMRDATYIPNGVFTPEKDTFRSIREEYGIPKNATVIFNIGSLTEQKRAHTFAECMGKVTGELDDVYVVMAGDGPLRAKVETYSSEQLRVLGHISDDEKWRWFSDADIFSSLSAYEGMPVATAEALSFNLPLVLSDIPAHRHLVEAYGPTAELVQNDIKSLTSAICNVNNQESHVDLPNWSDISKQYLNLING